VVVVPLGAARVVDAGPADGGAARRPGGGRARRGGASGSTSRSTSRSQRRPRARSRPALGARGSRPSLPPRVRSSSRSTVGSSVAETGDPIEESLVVRLRTLDLERKEELFTNPDGSFVSATAYRSGVLLALVKARDGRELADHEAGFDPAANEEWLVRIPSQEYPTLVRGTVVDRRGDPVAEVPVRIVARAHGGTWDEVLSGRNGLFELNDLRAGSYALLVHGLWRPAEPIDLVLRAGRERARRRRGRRDARRGAAGPLRVRGRFGGSSGGARRGTARGSAARGAVLLVLRGRSAAEASSSSASRAFPAGRAALSVESLDGRTYALAPERVRVPGVIEIRVSERRVPDARCGCATPRAASSSRASKPGGDGTARGVSRASGRPTAT
jgi:hypothetical protein